MLTDDPGIIPEHRDYFSKGIERQARRAVDVRGPWTTARLNASRQSATAEEAVREGQD